MSICVPSYSGDVSIIQTPWAYLWFITMQKIAFWDFPSFKPLGISIVVSYNSSCAKVKRE
jgi:hypothetical protein